MKWVAIGDIHVNADNLDAFRWHKGVLYLDFQGCENGTKLYDPARVLYIKLCAQLGVRPFEGV